MARKLIAAALFALSLAPSFAQAPPPVPGLPDTERRTSYSISSSTCVCTVNFALYGDSTDYWNWLEVWINNVRVNYNDPVFGWTITSPTGPLATIPRPITDAVLTFNSAQTGTVQIVGARRPRRVSQFAENRGVAARDLNQALTDIVAQNRETWDKTNDVTGRAVLGLPGETLGPLPPASVRAGGIFTFDGNGNPGVTAPTLGSGNVIGIGPAVVGHVAVFSNTSATGIADGGPFPTLTPTVVSYATRAAGVLATIPSNVTTIILQGYGAANDGGGGVYTRLASAPGTVRNWHFQSLDGAWWQLQVPMVVPRQVGAACNGTTDDTVPAQAWVDYSSTFGAISLGQICNMAVPTATINLPSLTNIQGLKQLTITRTTDVVAQLLQGTNAAKVSVRGLIVVCQCGFSSTTSNSIVTGTQTFTVPAGLTLSTTAPNNNIQIMATSAPINYLIAQITAYTPIGGGLASLTINTVSGNAVGSGTFSAWTLASYPVSGDIEPVPAALSFVGCTDSIQEDNIVSGPFYDGIDNRNGNRETVNGNYVTNWINRGIHEAAYLSVFSNDIHITNNTLIGGTVSEYGINTSGTDGAQIAQMVISGNTVRGYVGQGINTSGQVIFVSTVNNTVIASSFGATTAAGFLVESLPTSIPQHVTIAGNTVSGGANGVYVIGALYVNVSDNNISAAANGVSVQGSGAASSTTYITVTGNIVQSGSGNGFNVLGAVAGGVVGINFANNQAVAFTGWGFFVNNTTNIIFGGGNQALGNTAGGYSVNGTTTTPAAANQ